MQVNLGKSDFVTIAGSAMVAVGAFMPMVEIARIGTMSYAKATGNPVYLLIALAVIASGLIFAGKRDKSLFAAVGAWLVLLWPVIKNMGGGDSGDSGGLMDKLSKVTDPIQKAASDVAGKIFSNVFDMELGGYVFLIGMILVLAGSVMAFMAARKAA